MNRDALSAHNTEGRTPDYGYVNGLQIDRHIYGGEPSHTKHTIAYEETYNTLTLPEHTPQYETVTSKLGNAALEWIHVRSAQDTGTVNIVLMGWAGDNENDITQNGLRYHVAHNPHAHIIHINNPAHGNSSRLPRSMSKHIAKTGHFAPQGELHAQLINEALKDYDEVNISGHSYGGRQALALAAALDQPVDNIHLFDPPGSRNLGGLAGIGKAFMTLEGKHAGLYGQHAPDQSAAAIQSQGDSTPLQDILRLIKRRGFSQQFFDQTAAMSKAGLEHDLALACRNVRDTVRFTSPELSELNYVSSVSDILDRIATADRLIQHDIVTRHTHSMIASNPNILAYLHRSGA